MDSETLSKRLFDATWASERPVDALRQLCLEIGHDLETADLSTVLRFAELALRLREPQLLQRASQSLGRFEANPWAYVLLAELDRLHTDTERLAQRLALAHQEMDSYPTPLATCWLRVASRVGVDQLAQLAERTSDTEALELVLFGGLDHGPSDLTVRHGRATRLAQRCNIDETSATDVLSYISNLPSPTNRHLDWTDPEATDPGWIKALLDRIASAKSKQQGLSIIRLGDGEGLYLHRAFGSVDGYQRREPLEFPDDPPEYRHDKMHLALARAIRRADLCLVPDLRYLVHGPIGGVAVFQWLLGSGVPTDNLVAGPVFFGFDLEALGLTDRLISMATGVIGPVDPAGLEVFGGKTVQWHRVPSSDYPGNPESHLRDSLPRIVGERFKPGEVWLVAAGMPGKIYCQAIKDSGAVAVDVGSVMDLWAGRTETRFNARLHPWLARRFVSTS